ncbi:MAG: hypothetical protein H7099_15200 [Gemmatimonadaceae bacterium]|nr:hypothetical protein [Gemmatimonadaceae bacterium]
MTRAILERLAAFRASTMTAAALVALCAAPAIAGAQAAATDAKEARSTSAETRAQTDSLSMYFARSPKGKPAALSVGGKVASHARKLDGKHEHRASAAPVSTPLPTRARTTKP